MSLEDLATCPRCKTPLSLTPIWADHERRWREPRICWTEFELHCKPCNWDYLLKDNTLLDKGPTTVSNAVDEAPEPLEKENAVDYRCRDCGRPTVLDPRTSLLGCLWCNQEYALSNGKLQPYVRSKFAASVQ